MTCENCDPNMAYPGRCIKCTPDLMYCEVCGDPLHQWNGTDFRDVIEAKQKRWDTYFHLICEAVASKSPCLSRKIGAILVQDYSIVATGYNGPARGVPHCESAAFPRKSMEQKNKLWGCPRKAKGFKTGEGLELCPAEHAESNCIANAARLGVSVLGTTLYMNCIAPCKRCAGILINAGISEIVVDSTENYDELGKFILSHSNIRVRRFNL